MFIFVVVSPPLQLRNNFRAFLPVVLDCLASEDPGLLLLLDSSDHGIAVLWSHVHEHQSILYEIALYEFVEGTLAAEAWRIVDFEQPGSLVTVDHDVEAQNLKTHVVL